MDVAVQRHLRALSGHDPWLADAPAPTLPSAQGSAPPVGGSRLAALAEQIQRLQKGRRRRTGLCPTGLEELDRALGGGLAWGAIHELLAPNGAAPARSIALRAAAQAVRFLSACDFSGWDGASGGGRGIIYLDVAGDLYPLAAAALGVPLSWLIVVRIRGRADALWACEQALRCRGVAAVIASLRGVDTYVSRRLQLAAEAGGGLGLLLRDDAPREPSFAASRVQFDPLPAPLGVRRMRVQVLKLRGSRLGEPFVLEWGRERTGCAPRDTRSAAG